MTRQIGFIFAALTALVIATPASAQTMINGALRLHLEVDALQIISETETPEGVDDGTTTTTIAFGPGGETWGFGVGLGVADNIVVGGNLRLQYLSISVEDADEASTGFGLTLAPYFEFLLGEGSTRPFVGATVFVDLLSGENASQTMFGLGGLGGVHVFMADSFSFDVSGRLLFATGSKTVDVAGVDADTDITKIGLQVLLGVSGWSI